MKVLLCEDVKKIGYYGDIVDVAEGFARNYLLPQRLAVIPSDQKLKAMVEEKAKRSEQRLRQRKLLEAAAAAVNGAEAVISAKANEQGILFGSISPAQIVANLQAQGFEVTEDAVSLTHHIKSVGAHKVVLEYAEDLTATITLTVVAEGQPAGEAAQPEQKSENPESAPPAPQPDSQNPQ
jgi:large subunit ribosomal protein L9